MRARVQLKNPFDTRTIWHVFVEQHPFTILTAYIISPSNGKGLSSSNSSVLYLRASSMLHCSLGFKYHNFSRLAVRSTEFGQVTVKLRPSHLPWWLYPTFYTLLPWQSRVSSHNLVSRVRAIVCSENDILTFIQSTLKSLVILAIWLALNGAIYSRIAPSYAQNRIFFLGYK